MGCVLIAITFSSDSRLGRRLDLYRLATCNNIYNSTHSFDLRTVIGQVAQTECMVNRFVLTAPLSLSSARFCRNLNSVKCFRVIATCNEIFTAALIILSWLV